MSLEFEHGFAVVNDFHLEPEEPQPHEIIRAVSEQPLFLRTTQSGVRLAKVERQQHGQLHTRWSRVPLNKVSL